MTKRITCCLILAFALPFISEVRAVETASQGGKIAPGGPTLKVALEKGLEARLKSEFQFIDVVVRKVDNGELPKKMVDRTFLWARDNRQPYPMPYFEAALRIQAKKLKVTLPPVERGISKF